MDLGIGKKLDFSDNPERYLCTRYKPGQDKGLLCYMLKGKKTRIALEDITIGAVSWMGTLRALWRTFPEAFVAMEAWRKRWAVWFSVNYFLVDYNPSSRSGEGIEGTKAWVEDWREACERDFQFK